MTLSVPSSAVALNTQINVDQRTAVYQAYNDFKVNIQSPSEDFDQKLRQLDRVTKQYENSAKNVEDRKKAYDNKLLNNTSGKVIKWITKGTSWTALLGGLGVAIAQEYENQNKSCQQSISVLVFVICVCVFEFFHTVVSKFYKDNKKEAEKLSAPLVKEAEEYRRMVSFFKSLSALAALQKSDQVATNEQVVEKRLESCVNEFKQLPSTIASEPTPKDQWSSLMLNALPQSHPVKQTMDKLYEEAAEMQALKRIKKKHKRHLKHGTIEHHRHHHHSSRIAAPTAENTPSYFSEDPYQKPRGSLHLAQADGAADSGSMNLSAISHTAASPPFQTIEPISNEEGQDEDKEKLLKLGGRFAKRWGKLEEKLGIRIEEFSTKGYHINRRAGIVDPPAQSSPLSVISKFILKEKEESLPGDEMV